MSRNFNDGPENFAANIRSLQQNILAEDRWRNSWVFYNNLFDLRSNGTIKRIGLILWAVLLILPAVTLCSVALSSGSFQALASFALIGIPSLLAAVAGLWTACFLHPPRHGTHFHHHRHRR